MDILNKEQYLSKILLGIYDSANWLFDDDRWAGSEDTFIKLLNQNDFLFAYNESKVVGFLSYNSGIKGCVVITGLYVEKEFQNQGVAARLLANLICKLSNIEIYAEVMNNAPWAKDFYEKNGFNLMPKHKNLSEDLKKLINHNEWSCIYKKGG